MLNRNIYTKYSKNDLSNAKHLFPSLRHLPHNPTTAQRHLAHIDASKRTQSTQLAAL